MGEGNYFSLAQTNTNIGKLEIKKVFKGLVSSRTVILVLFLLVDLFCLFRIMADPHQFLKHQEIKKSWYNNCCNI